MASLMIRKANIQGDIWPGLPKRFQTFLFFQIQNPDAFKGRLKRFLPRITTAEQACQYKDRMKAAKEEADRSGMRKAMMALPGINIAFTSTGLTKLGKFVLTAKDQGAVKKDRALSQVFRDKQLRGGLFEKGMYADLTGEGWDDPQEIRTEYKPFGPDNERLIDGVLLVTSSCPDDFQKQVAEVTDRFEDEGVVRMIMTRHGTVRPGEHKGKEHFGYMDGISQPVIEGLDTREPVEKEPVRVKPGLILCGQPGDCMPQPAWAKDGSFLVIRDLQQLVPEYDNWLEENASKAPFTAGHKDPPQKLAAYLMGRWKNGTPVDESPDDDGGHKINLSNNFDFEPRDEHHKCPFAAHIRKMRPRADLSNDHAVIIRRGIPYGEEVSEQEKAARQSDIAKDRGLLFTCYQSDVRTGFNFLTTRWASNHQFPDGKDKVVNGGPGIDPIVGQRLPIHPARSIGLPDKEVASRHRMTLDRWVIHKGGEYFFSPSIEAMEGYLTGPSDYSPVFKAKL
ncbi:Peroxidase [Lachnellula occidentalis]|uniref:Peroxidase n=1 Tax=Lachnellula occidentalis TaxID=215460 RepID=A0A8H8UEL6_9HELO|nr:Peroxidase [Lachnellula occidentalis]